MMRFLILIALFAASNAASYRSTFFPQPVYEKFSGVHSGEPLFLTPYLKKGQFEEARRLSEVNGLPNLKQKVTSFSGFLTVNETLESNMFFWFFPALNNDTKAPLLLWLQGGPGGSSLFGLFNENGPLKVNEDLSVDIRKYSWTEKYALLYIDNPVQTGFSFTKKEAGYATNEDDVARDLYEALKQFFAIFHDYKTNDFYITGESYAGKYVPAIAHKIHVEKLKNNNDINMKGVAIGDGLVDPENMIRYSEFLYQVGLLDDKQAEFVKQQEEQAVKYIKKGEYYEAFKIFDFLLNGDLSGGQTYFTNATGLTYYYNFLFTNAPPEFSYYQKYIELSSVRKAIHVGNLTYNDGHDVEQHLVNDIMQSVKPWLAVLMDNYKVLIYSGQLDIIVAAPLTESFLKTVDWKHKDEYLKLNKKIWKVSDSDSEVAGYVRSIDQFYHVIVRNAGHILPHDQPRPAFDMIDKFINNQL